MRLSNCPCQFLAKKQHPIPCNSWLRGLQVYRQSGLDETPLKPQGNPFGSGQGGPIEPWLSNGNGVPKQLDQPEHFANSKDCLSYYFAWLVGSQVFHMSIVLLRFEAILGMFGPGRPPEGAGKHRKTQQDLEDASAFQPFRF